MTKEKYINPYTDFGFKKLFGTEMNKDLLISFLNALFNNSEKEIEDIQYLNSENLGDGSGDRRSVFDVYCTTKDGSRFIVEIQKAEQAFFKDRSVYYATTPIRQQAPKGPWNYHLENVYTVGILNSDDERWQYEESKKVFWDNYSVMKTAVDNNSKEIARRMKARGYSIEDIAAVTDLSVDEIKKL